MNWITWAIVGAVIGILVGMFGVSVGGASNGEIWPTEHLTVSVFGVTVHEQSTVTESWHGRVWGIGLTAAFGLLGAGLGVGVSAIKNRFAGTF